MAYSSSPRRLKAETFTVEDLLESVQEGRLRVPHFQRGLKWRTRHILDLFDSIYQGFPIGDFLLGEKPAEAELISFGRVTIEANERQDAWFIVDGQQRLTALAGAMLHPAKMPYGDRHAIWFDLEEERFEWLKSSHPPITWLPLNMLPDSTQLLDWLSHWPLRVERPDLVKRAMRVSKTLREYRAPVYILDGSDERALRMIFKRVNTAGVPMEEHEVFDALHGEGQQRPLRDGCQRLNDHGFGTIKERWFERIVRIVCGQYRRRREGPIEWEDVRKAEVALRLTMTFLNVDAGIPHVGLLPYRLPLLILPRFFHLYPDPSPRDIQLLSRWVWRGALSRVHGDNAESTVATLCTGMDKSRAPAFTLLSHVQADWEPLDLTAQWNAGSAKSKLFSLALWHLAPLQTTGAPQHVSEGAWDALRRTVRSPFTDHATCLAERMLFVGEDSSPLSHRSWDALPMALTGASDDVLSSHALSRGALKALSAGERELFVSVRTPRLAQQIQAVFQARAGIGQSDRPAISVLLAQAAAAKAP